MDENNEKIYFEANKDNIIETQLYVVDFDGKKITRLTKAPGTHSTTISPNGKYFYDSYSDINSPGKLDLFDESGNLIRNLGDRKSNLYDEYNLGKVETFTIKTSDGLELPATWVLPPNFDPNKISRLFLFMEDPDISELETLSLLS